MWNQQPQQQQQQQQQPQGFFGSTASSGFGGGYGQQQPQQQQMAPQASGFGGGFGQSSYGQQQQPQSSTFQGGFGTANQSQLKYGTQAPTQVGAPAAKSPDQFPTYYKSGIQFDQTVTTLNVNFTYKSENLNEANKNLCGQFYNIRADPKFQAHSTQMLKLLDMLANQKQALQPTYESIAMAEFLSNPQQYVFYQKAVGQPQQQQPAGFGGTQQTSAWGQQQTQQPLSTFNKPAFGSTAFGQTAQQPQTPGFGGQQSQGMGGGMFGQQQPQAGFGGAQQQKPLFGAATQQPAFGTQSAGLKPGFGVTQPAFGQSAPTMFGQQPQQQQQQPLFGQQQASTPLFGGQTQQQQPSMFGAQPLGQAQPLFGGQQQQPTQGMFGAAAPGGGLFGAGGQAQGAGIGLGASGQNTGIALGQTSSLGGGLFGGPKPQGQTLFGATPSQPAGSSLFGGAQQTQQQPGAGLFGAQPAAGTGLFGAKPLGQTSSLGGGMFGQTAQAQPGQQSLFGAQQPGGMFGQQPSQQPTGMFSLTGQQTQQAPPGAGQQQQQIFNPYGDPNKLMDPYGSSVKTTILQSVSPFENADAELKKLQEDIYQNKSADIYKDITPLDKMRMGLSIIATPGDGDEYMQNYEPAPQFLPSFEEKQRSLHDKLAEKYKTKYSQQAIHQALQERDQQQVYTQEGGFTQRPSIRPQKTFGTDSSFQLSRQSSMTSKQQQEEQQLSTPEQLRNLEVTNDKKIFRPVASSQVQSTTYSRPQQDTRQNPDILQIEVVYPEQSGFNSKTEIVNIHRTRDTIELYNKVRRLLKEEGRWTDDIKDVRLLHKNAIVNEQVPLKDAGIDKNSKVTLIFETYPRQQQQLEEVVKARIQSGMPKAPKKGYCMSPTMEELSKMSFQELQRVPNFTIWNEFGSVQFEGETDVTDVDLADVVTIIDKEVEVYNSEIHIPYPKVGQKLNKPAIITMANFTVPKKAVDNVGDYLKNLAGKINGEHVSYDRESKEWAIRVAHWTKYKLVDTDEDESVNMQDIIIDQIPTTIVQQQQYPELPSAFTRPVEGIRKKRVIDDEIMSQPSDHIEIVQKPKSQQPKKPLIVLRREEIQNNIAKRDKQIASVTTLYTQKKSLSESLAYLKNMGVEVKDHGFKNMPIKFHRFRPQFRNDGSLLVLKNDKLIIQEVSVIPEIKNKEQKQTYKQMAEIFLKHINLQEFNGKLTEDMRRMKISQQQLQFAQSMTDPTLQSLINKRQHKFDDVAIEAMLAKANLPVVSFKQDPHDMFFFYEDLAKYLITHSSNKTGATKEKLRQEFYIITIMNALFGNPNIHLVQLHPDFKGGVNNYQRARSRFAEQSRFVDGTTLENDKKRKNALSEVIRFICMSEFKVSAKSDTDDSTYKSALDYLLNGDVKNAVSILNQKKKHQMSAHVINCFGSQLTQSALQQAFTEQQSLYKGFTGSAKNLVNFMTGELLQQNQVKPEWQQALGYYLLVKSNPAHSLEKIISDFSSEVFDKFFADKFKGKLPLLWMLIKFYGMNIQEPNILHSQLMTYQGIQVNPKSPNSIQEYRMSFIITLSLHNLLLHRNSNSVLYKDRYHSHFVSHERLTHFTSLFVNQLMREKDWEQALLITSFVPQTQIKLRKNIVFNIMLKNASYLIKELPTGDSNVFQQLVVKHLRIPKELLFSARAILQQSLGNHESAMNDWIHSGNLNVAHKIFMKRIIPAYFPTPSFGDVSNVLTKLIASKSQIKEVLEQFEDQRVDDFKIQGNLISKLLKLLNNRVENNRMPEKQNETQISMVAKDLYFVKDCPSGIEDIQVIHRFIWELFLQWDKTLKISKARVELKEGSVVNRSIMDELLTVYPDSPQLSRVFDEFATEISTLVYCQRPQLSSQGNQMMEIYQ